MSDWQPVSVKPMLSGDYLVCYKFWVSKTEYQTAIKILSYSDFDGYWQDDNTCDETTDEITHWHDIPELPNEE